MSEDAVHLVVRGRVQGVGFRWFVRENARRGELRGWVRNNPDGSVEVVAKGDPECIDRLLVAVRRGPPGSHVDRIEECPTSDADDALPTPFTVLK